jgi:hypothetical protein
MEPIKPVDRSRMVVDALLSPVGPDQGQIQIPRRHLGLTLSQHFLGPRAECDGRQTGRTGEAFLGARVSRIHPPFVDFHGHTGQGSDAVHDQQGPQLVSDPAHLFHGLQDPRTGFPMHDAKGLERTTGPRLAQSIRIQGSTPLPFDLDHFCPRTKGHFGHALTEHSADSHQHTITGLDQVDQHGLHAGGSGAAHGHGQFIVRAKGQAQHDPQLIHDLEEGRIQVP